MTVGNSELGYTGGGGVDAVNGPAARPQSPVGGADLERVAAVTDPDPDRGRDGHRGQARGRPARA